MGSFLLEMKNISKSFGNVHALKDVSINLHQGEVVALMGENGAGKSTLMNILGGSIPHYTGEVWIQGNKVQMTDPIAAKKLGIAKIHQELQLVPEMTISENIFLGRWMSSHLKMIDFKRMHAETKKYLDMLELKVSPATKIKDLRIGEQQLVEIVKALSLNARIIIMDEPTSAISEEEAHRLFRIINALKMDGKGIIYITHRMEEVFEIADRLTVMRDGQCINTVLAQNTNKREIISMMVGRDLSEQYPKEPVKQQAEIMRIENLCYTPKRGSFKRSLHNISISLNRGEVLGIAGLVGSGRTELFECIFGMHHKSVTGNIFLDNQVIHINTPNDAIQAGISFVTEDRKGNGLVLQRSIGENMSLPLLKKFSKYFFMNVKSEQKQWSVQIKNMRIKASGYHAFASSLSGGNQQKVILGRWLMTQPKVLLLDEPTRGIDVGAKAEIYMLINKLAMAGMGIIVISSELPEVIGISDRIITFCEGKLTGEFLREDVTQEKLLHSATQREEKACNL